MTDPILRPNEPEAEATSLVVELSDLIEQAKASAASYANAALTLLHWRVGQMINGRVLRGQRADYGKRIVASVARQLAARFGRGFDEKTLRRMMQFAREFPDEQIVASLMRQLSWTHILELLPLKSNDARQFYARQAVDQRLSVRELRHAIESKAFERGEIADSQIGAGSAVPLDTFKDPYLLDFLGLHDTFSERDLETALIHGMREFLLEVGRGWAFVEQQKRLVIDTEDFYLDLLFYARPLRRLVAVELKIGKFKAAYEGQMKLYLKWLDRYERQEREEAPLGLILCTEAGREQIELLEMHKDGIVVAEYWTALPPKKELEERLQIILSDAKERLARRELGAAPDSERAAFTISEADEDV